MSSDSSHIHDILHKHLPLGLDLDELPQHPGLTSSIPHAPKRPITSLTPSDMKLAIKNALRYFPQKWHSTLAAEFRDELLTYGHIYCYRFRPTEYEIKAYPLSVYPGKSTRARSIMLMIMNNLDHAVAQFPEELVTYGGNGSAFSNWAQYRLTMKYLSIMTDEQTLTLYSGHPMGLFPSPKESPVMVITNGLMVPKFSDLENYTKGYALTNTQYGQMTAGSYCYIGPQGIVHGTTITVKNAGRKYLGVEDMRGKVFVTSGCGGMSGAQGCLFKTIECITVIAEVYKHALEKRYSQGWLKEIVTDLDTLIERIKEARRTKESTSIGYHGNIVDLWERLAQEEEMLVDLGSDQTSCHIPYTGGYYPVGYTWEESNKIMAEDPARFKELVDASLVRHMAAIDKMHQRGMPFFDYGNSLLNSAAQAGAPIRNTDPEAKHDFIYPSYVQDIMGDVFSLGFGPFRWVCTSGDPEDLHKTDLLAASVIKSLMEHATPEAKQQLDDNYVWITKAEENRLVVGSQARILYSDTVGRMQLALAFNKAVREGHISAPIVLSRDHHDVSGTDSPFRETSNIYDGSYATADMSTHTVIGLAQRGASWVALHNGGGTGWGYASNCGFGFVLDGSEEVDERAKMMLFWDVSNGLSRRQWSYHPYAKKVVEDLMRGEERFKITMAEEASDELIDGMFEQ